MFSSTALLCALVATAFATPSAADEVVAPGDSSSSAAAPTVADPAAAAGIVDEDGTTEVPSAGGQGAGGGTGQVSNTCDASAENCATLTRATYIGTDAQGDPAAKPEFDYCLDARRDNVRYYTRSNSCASSFFIYTTYRVVNGQRTETGKMDFFLTNFKEKRGGANIGDYIDARATYAYGAATSVTFQLTPSSACGNCTSSRGLQRFVLTEAAGIKQAYTVWTENLAQQSMSTSVSKWSFTVKSAQYPASAGEYSDNIVYRCDRDLAKAATSGCVVPAAIPVITFNQNHDLDDFASHLTRAINSGLPTTLNRETDSSAIDGNRSTACKDSYPRPSGLSCDEYPFASTTQGAAANPNRPRTFAGCQITLGQASSTGAAGFSVCMIVDTENTKAGSRLGGFYASSRVIDNDLYRVQVVAP